MTYSGNSIHYVCTNSFTQLQWKLDTLCLQKQFYIATVETRYIMSAQIVLHSYSGNSIHYVCTNSFTQLQQKLDILCLHKQFYIAFLYSIFFESTIGKHKALRREVKCQFKLYPKKQGEQETTVVYTHEYSIILPMIGIGQLSKINACCLPINQVPLKLNYS